MPRLRDYFSSDLDTFFNVDEFGEIHTLGTKEINMIIEEENDSELTRRAEDLENATRGIYESLITIYLKSSEYKKPSIGRRISLDGQHYYVVDSSVSEGVLKMVLGANES